jgi:hypothetical protein
VTRLLDAATDTMDIPGIGSVSYVNEAGIPSDLLPMVAGHPDIARALTAWSANVSSSASQANSLFFRDRFSVSDDVYDQMARCSDAVNYDDVLLSVAEATEALAFHSVTFECLDADEEDVWNQIADDLNLTTFLRALWRENFKTSQAPVVVRWGSKSYTVRTKAPDRLASRPPAQPAPLQVPGAPPFEPPDVPRRRRRRKAYDLKVPLGLTIVDHQKVLPVGNYLFGDERLVYLADLEEELVLNDRSRSGQLFEGRYEFTDSDRTALGHRAHEGSGYLFRQDAAFRTWWTKSNYERFASVRLKAALPLLDIKQHLRAADRSILVASTNFILLIRRGTDRWPAKPQEITQLREQSRAVARVPVLVGDHRLSVEIVTPKTDFTLDEARYAVLDERLRATAMATLVPKFAGSVETALDLASRSIEAKRGQITERFEDEVIDAVMSKNSNLTERPTLVFHPRRVTLRYNADLVNAVLKLRDRGDISRQTELEELDFDQDAEFLRRTKERDLYDSAFKSSVPFSSPGANPFASNEPEDEPTSQPGGGNTPGPVRQPLDKPSGVEKEQT